MINLPTSRSEALKLGLHLYDTGKPCKRGHLSTRYTLTCNCVQCMTERVAQDRTSFRQTAAGRASQEGRV